MANECLPSGARNTGQACNATDAQDKKDFLVALDYTATDQATIMEKAWWTTGIQSGYIYPLPDMKSKESQDSGAVYESTPIYEQFISNGTIARMEMIPANTEMYKRLRSHSGNTSDFGIITVTANGNIRAKLNDDSTIGAFKLSVLNVENPIENDGSAGSSAPLKYTLKNPEAYRTQALMFSPSFDALDLEGLTDTVFNIVSASATVITFTINKQADNSTIQDAKLVYGAVVDDLTLLDVAGDAQTIGVLSGGALADLGVYTLTGTAYVTGTLNFVDSSLMDTLGYNGYTAGTVTVV